MTTETHTPMQGGLAQTLHQSRCFDDLLKALKLCRDQFAFYAREHQAAGKHEKAATNDMFARRADEAINRAEGRS